MAPEAATKLWHKRQSRGTSQKAHEPDCAAIALFIAVEVQANPIDVLLGLHARQVQWCTILIGHIMKDGHVLYASFAQHSSNTRHTPADLVLFISNPIDMPGHVLPLSDGTIAWWLNSSKI